MKRGYTVLEYKSIVRRLRAVRPDLRIGSDFIVGFPGESDEDHAATLRLIAEVGFDASFSFVYSARPGTPAANLEDPVPHETKIAWLMRLQAKIESQAAAVSARMVGTVQRVLVEAVVSADVGPLRVMTTHLEYYSHAQRHAQINAIRRLHAEARAMSMRTPLAEEQGGSFEVYPRPAQALLCGDLNFPASAPERAQILATFNDGTPDFHDAWTLLHPGEPHAPTVGIHPVDFVKQPECFDFVFVTEGLASHLKVHGIDAETESSDHQPVWVEFV